MFALGAGTFHQILATNHFIPSTNLDRFGGWTGKKFAPTGFFSGGERPEMVDGYSGRKRFFKFWHKPLAPKMVEARLEPGGLEEKD